MPVLRASNGGTSPTAVNEKQRYTCALRACAGFDIVALPARLRAYFFQRHGRLITLCILRYIYDRMFQPVFIIRVKTKNEETSFAVFLAPPGQLYFLLSLGGAIDQRPEVKCAQDKLTSVCIIPLD